MNQDSFFATKAVHAGQHGDPVTGAVVAPMFLTSTYEWTAEKMERYQRGDKEGIFTYGRSRNPTQNDLQDKLAALYGSEACLVTASGMAAISLALLNLVGPGDHVISCRTIYGGTYGLFSKIFEELKIEVTFLDEMTEQTLAEALQPNTKVVYGESVFNPTLEVLDLPMMVKWAKAHNISTVVDNTFLSPYLFNPFAYGVDVVVDSATKYINGHGDLIAGTICGKADYIEKIRSSFYMEMGPVPSPFSCWLMLRGLKTLHLRMRAHCENAMEVAKWLKQQPQIESVSYPGLEDDPYHERAKALYGEKGYGGMVAFVVKGGFQAAQKMLGHVKLAKYAVSLGDLDTMIQQPAVMTHNNVEPEQRVKMGIADGMVRLSVGVEDWRDVAEDLRQALNA